MKFALTKKCCLNIHISNHIYIYIDDLALNNLQWLICHETQPNHSIYIGCKTVEKYSTCYNIECISDVLETYPKILHVLQSAIGNERIKRFRDSIDSAKYPTILSILTVQSSRFKISVGLVCVHLTFGNRINASFVTTALVWFERR